MTHLLDPAMRAGGDAGAGSGDACDRSAGSQRVRGRRRRLDLVLDLVIDHGHLGVDDLVRELGVSPATVRRDLDALADQQLVIRSHGRASAHPDSRSLPMRYRASSNATMAMMEKVRFSAWRN